MTITKLYISEQYNITLLSCAIRKKGMSSEVVDMGHFSALELTNVLRGWCPMTGTSFTR